MKVLASIEKSRHISQMRLSPSLMDFLSFLSTRIQEGSSPDRAHAGVHFPIMVMSPKLMGLEIFFALSLFVGK